MKIAIDVSPLSSGHKVRGVGFYLKHLQDALEKYFPEHEYIWFEKTSEIPKNVDVLHYPYFDPFQLTLPLRRKYKTVVTVHDLTPLVFPQLFPAGFKGLIKWRVQRLALQNMSGIIGDSQCSRKDIIKLAGVKPHKVSVVYLAAGEEFERFKIDDVRIKRVKEKYHLPKKFALYVGDVTPNKNVPRIVQACLSANIPLVMVGKALAQPNFDRTSPWNKDLVAVQKLVAHGKNVCTLGFVPDEDLVSLYNCAALALMPSLYEGFGLPVIEAMSCGCPVVTSHGGSLTEVAGDGAYIVDPENIDSIAEGIHRVLNENSLQQALREKGFKQVKKFSWKKTAEETIKVYESVLRK